MSRLHPDPDRLNAFLVDDLDVATRREIAAHLEVCPGCRESVARLTAALAAYRDALPEAADEAALARLIAVSRPVRPRSFRRWTAAAMAAAAAMVFMSGFWMGRTDARRSFAASVQTTPAVAPAPVRDLSDGNPPMVTFAVADSDLLGGLARRDTIWN